MFAMLAPLFAGKLAAGGLMAAGTAKAVLTAGGAVADSLIAKKRQQAAYDKQKADASNKFVDMSAAAKKAGFNPLTVLRNTGGAGFGSYGEYIPSAQFSLLGTAALSFGRSMYEQKVNEPIDKYNKELRDLELAQRKIDLKLGKQQLKIGNGVLAGGGFSGGARPTLDAAPEVMDVLEQAQLVDPRRGAEAAPVVSGAGITVIDSPVLGKIMLPGADGEPWGIDELMTAVIATPYSKSATMLGDLYPKEPTAPKDGTINIGSRWRQRLKLERQYNPDFGKLSWPSGFGGGGFAPSM